MDIRYAVRTLRRDPGFTLFATLIVGLGIGASATVFSLMNAVLLKPMAFHDPKRLVWIANVSDNGVDEWRLEVFNYLDLKNRSRSVTDMAGYYAYYGAGNSPITENGEVRRFTRVPVTCNLFPFLGVKPLLGRSFTADECSGRGPNAVLITERFWRSHYGADRGVVGRTITLGDAPTTIVGVLPESFDFPSIFAPGTSVELFSPFPLTIQTDHQGNTLAVIGRLAPNATVQSAQKELVALGKEITEAHRGERNPVRPRVMALDARVNGRVRPALFVLSAAVAAEMLIVSANLSSLQLARAAARRRELAVRLALGATRGHLIRQTLIENLVLTALGAALGVVVAVIGTRMLANLTAFQIPLLSRVGVDGSVLAVILAVTVGTGLLVGVSPALHSPADVQDTLKEGSRGTTRGMSRTPARTIMVVAEIAAASVLLVGTALLARSFVHVLDVQLGYRPEHARAMRVDPPRRLSSDTAANIYYDEILRRVRAVPGVSHASLGDLLPFGGDRSWSVSGEGQTWPRDHVPEAFIRVVGTDWVGTMGLRLEAGRDFDDADRPGAPNVVIVNETLARTLWPGREAIGQNIQNRGTLLHVVGVVGDVRHDALERRTTSELYFPMRQYFDYGSVQLVVRTQLSGADLARAVRSTLEPVAPSVAHNEWRPLTQLVDQVLSPRRFVVMLLTGFAAFALLLAALGIYALVSHGVTQRRNEIGIRMALGATTRDVGAMVMQGTIRIAVVGVGIGIVAAFAVGPALQAMLFGVNPEDPGSFVLAIATLLVAALLAGWIPARRAARVDPAVALRE